MLPLRGLLLASYNFRDSFHCLPTASPPDRSRRAGLRQVRPAAARSFVYLSTNWRRWWSPEPPRDLRYQPLARRCRFNDSAIW